MNKACFCASASACTSCNAAVWRMLKYSWMLFGVYLTALLWITTFLIISSTVLVRLMLPNDICLGGILSVSVAFPANLGGFATPDCWNATEVVSNKGFNTLLMPDNVCECGVSLEC